MQETRCKRAIDLTKLAGWSPSKGPGYLRAVDSGCVAAKCQYGVLWMFYYSKSDKVSSLKAGALIQEDDTNHPDIVSQYLHTSQPPH